mmetsp:Transcript_67864/g.153581  ORF Transcript_67864/g.153581 Transcript_67864/m.153581 type:complete len:277 (+) Transcript_67864:1-831(+)
MMPKDIEKGTLAGNKVGYGAIGGGESATNAKSGMEGVWEVLVSFAPLGFIAFGGPMAHVGLLQTVFVEKKRWMTDETFTELLALGHSLPGPTSTQMVVAVAASRGGLLGAMAAFVMWSLPAFFVLVGAAMGAVQLSGGEYGDLKDIWWLKGLPPAAVALIFSAAYKMGVKSCSDTCTRALGLLSACVIVLASSSALEPHVFDFLYPGLLIVGAAAALAVYSADGGGGAGAGGVKSGGLDVRISMTGGAILIAFWAATFGALSYMVSSVQTRPTGVR